MSSFFSCFACGNASNQTTATPMPVTPSKVMPQLDETPSKLQLTRQLSDNKSHSATTMTYMTTDSFPVSTEDEESYIRKKIEQIRKKDFPERKAMESEFIRQNLTKSAVVYLVEKEWSQLYTNFLKNIEVRELRSINNSRLFDHKNAFRNDVREKEDYFIINERVWKFVQQMYGGGPPIVQDMYFPVVSLSTRKIEARPVGIINPLFLCYMISLLQTMLSNQHFLYYFSKKMYDDSKKKMICHSICNRIVKQITDASQNRIDIKDLASLFENRFSLTEQHDAHEFFIHFSNLIQEQAKSEQTPKKEEAKSAEIAYSEYFKYNKSIIDRLFVGQTETVVQCTRCFQKSTTYDPFLDILLDLQQPTLEACLKSHFQTDKIQDYQCEKCNKKTKALKKNMISKTPNYLILTMKKFTSSGKKIEDRVKYPTQLNIRSFCKGHCGDTRYILQSILVHKGTKSNKGHYYVYTRRDKKSWHYMSDDVVKPIEPQQVLGRDAYMLFYERLK